MQEEATNIHYVPDQVLLQIFGHFHVRELLVLTRVCKHWQKLVSEKWLWKKVVFSPEPIKKVQLGKIVRRYFTRSTRSVDICGTLRVRKSPYAISNKVLNNITEKSPNLATFKLEDESLSDVNLQLLPSSLHHLSFTKCEIPLSSLEQCSNKFSHLKSLLFRRCPCLNDKHIRAFGRLENLESLEIYGSYRIDQDAIRLIANNFPNLHTLVLIGCAMCNDQSCLEIATKLTKLRSLEIEEWTGMTHTGIDFLQRHAKLKFLSVKCQQINNGNLIIHGSRLHL